MKLVPKNNQPNIYATRFNSVSPSLAIDSLGHPNISWITSKNGHNEINFEYWNGSTWAFYGNSASVSTEAKIELTYTQNNLALDAFNQPALAYVEKSTSGKDILFYATANTVSNVWTTSSNSVSYDTLWLATLSNASVVTYGDDNSIRVYENMVLSNSVSVNVSNVSSLQAVECGSKIGLSYYDGGILYNFFDTVANTWSHTSFVSLANSVSSKKMVAISSTGKAVSDPTLMFAVSLQEASNTSLSFYTVNSSGSETSAVLEANNVSGSMSLSDDLGYCGYTACGIMSQPTGEPWVIACGSSNALFINDGFNWTKNSFDMEAGCGIKPLQISASYNNVAAGVAMTMSSHTGIFFFEQSVEVGFEIVYPSLALLNRERLYIAEWVSGAISNGQQVLCAYNNKTGDLLRDGANPIVIVDSDIDPCCNY